MAALAGIGFTVSLFITDLAYTDPALLGIFAASAAAALLGTGLLLALTSRPAAPRVRRGLG